jgi:hypothetical protein
LADADSSSAASRDVAKAEIVIIAAHPGHDWPNEFKSWVESWSLPRERRLSALGALLSPVTPDTQNCGRQTYLQQVAKTWNLDFLHAASDYTLADTKSDAKNHPTTNIPPDVDFEVDHAADSPYCGING